MSIKKKAVIFIGPPGSGKGFVGSILVKFGYHLLSMSSILKERFDKDPILGKSVSNTMESGGLVSDDIVVQSLIDKISDLERNSVNSLLLDGCTRTIGQTKSVYDYLYTNGYDVCFVYLVVHKEVCINRISIRVSESGKSPRVDDLDDSIRDKRLRFFYDKIEEIWRFAMTKGFSVDAERNKVSVICHILEQLSYRDFV